MLNAQPYCLSRKSKNTQMKQTLIPLLLASSFLFASCVTYHASSTAPKAVAHRKTWPESIKRFEQLAKSGSRAEIYEMSSSSFRKTMSKSEFLKRTKNWQLTDLEVLYSHTQAAGFYSIIYLNDTPISVPRYEVFAWKKEDGAYRFNNFPFSGMDDKTLKRLIGN